jgi:energy-coupling factor transporter ATP-binding protein EcfA2
MFQREVCWQPERTYTVMNTQAESAPDAVFTAVHSEFPLQLITDPLNLGSSTPVEQSRFLEDFLSPSRNHVLAVVIGQTGSGKSHLVHWMKLHIPETDTRHVVTVARAGTTLRSIVQQLIDQLVPGDRTKYQTALDSAPPTTESPEQLQREIIAGLIHELLAVDDSDEARQYLSRQLVDFLSDPVMQSYHLAPTGIVADLARHVSEPGRIEGREARRRFTEDDLHINEVLGPRLNDLAVPTRRIVGTLSSSRMQQMAVDLLNSCLDAAIVRVLGFNSTQLVDLLRDLRRHLETQGKELVLLFEDFVRSEGIDRALLEALTVEAPGLGIATMRSLVAVTRGYYLSSFLPTQKGRVNFLIDMDASKGASGQLDPSDIARFAARYLNALRMPADRLADWYNDELLGVHRPLPNSCDGCQWRSECHAAFAPVEVGGIGEVGTYPFTEDALSNMYTRRGETSQFNPRLLLDRILKPIADHGAAAIRDGAFPSKALLDEMGGGRLSPEFQRQLDYISRRDATRLLTLFELWCREPGAVHDLPAGIFVAFDLPPVNLGTPPPPPVQREASPGATPAPPIERPADVQAPAQEPSRTRVPANIGAQLQHVTDWFNGEQLLQTTAQRLRELVFQAVTEYIDWDSRHWTQSAFAAATTSRPFQNRSVNFVRQQQQASRTAVQLELPTAGSDFQTTALALRGLLVFSTLHSWDYENGATHLQALSDCLEAWSAEVIRQLQAHPAPVDEWDSLTSAVETLYVGAILAGKVSSNATLPERIDGLFADWPAPEARSGYSDAWARLYKALCDDRVALTDFVRNRALLNKGQRGSLVDAARLAPVIERLESEGTLSPVRPNTVTVELEWRTVDQRHRDVHRYLAASVEAEAKARQDWLSATRERIPAVVEPAAVTDAIADLLRAADAQGVSTNHGAAATLAQSLQSFRDARISEAIASAEQLQDLTGLQLAKALAANNDRFDRDVASQFFRASEALFSAVESYTESKRLAAGDGAAGLVDSIEDDFQEIDEALGRLEAAL